MNMVVFDLAIQDGSRSEAHVAVRHHDVLYAITKTAKSSALFVGRPEAPKFAEFHVAHTVQEVVEMVKGRGNKPERPKGKRVFMQTQPDGTMKTIE